MTAEIPKSSLAGEPGPRHARVGRSPKKSGGAALMLACGMLGFGVFSPMQAWSTSWPLFRRDASRTAYVSETASPPLTARWQYSVPGAILSSPVAAYDNVYVGSRSSYVYCFDAYTGGPPKWTFPPAPLTPAADWFDATPAISSGVIYAPNMNGYIYAIDALTGAEKWRYQTGSRDVGSPFVFDNEVYVLTGYPKKQLLVLSAPDGTLRRSVNLTQSAVSSPVLDPDNGNIFVGTTDGMYMAYRSGLSPLWTQPVQTRGSIQMATPALAGGKLMAMPGDDDWKTHALGPSDGSSVWSSPALSADKSQATSVAVSSISVFGGAGITSHALSAMKLSDGSLRWQVPLGQASAYGVASSPAVADDMAYVLSPAGELYGVRTGTGGVVEKIALSAGEGLSSPAVANGWVYAGTMGGTLFAFEADRVASVSYPDILLDEPGGSITVRGTAASSDLASYTVEYGTGADPSSWALLSQGNASVIRGPLAVWDATDFPEVTYSLRVTVTENSGYSFRAQHAFNLSQLKSATVTESSGAVVTLGDGTECEIPAGAIEGTDTIFVRRVVSESGMSAMAFTDRVNSLGIIREFRLGNNPKPVFKKPVTLKIPYHTASPRKVENVRMFWFDDQTGKWQTVNTSNVVPDEKRVWAEVDHFTFFSLMEFVPSDGLLEEAEVYAAPNPARGRSVTFKYRVWDDSEVTIRVYDATGSRLATLSQSMVLGGTVGSLDWDISAKASGIYIFVVEARGRDGQKSRISKKFAIIH